MVHRNRDLKVEGSCISICQVGMGWLRLVGCLKLQVAFEEYCLFYRALLQKRPIILRSLLIVATPYIDCLLYIIAKHPAWSGELTGGSQWTSVTVYTKHVHVMFNQQTVNPLQTLGAQIRTSSQKKILKELYSKSANCSRTLPKTGLSVTSFLVYAAVARRSAHELSHD